MSWFTNFLLSSIGQKLIMSLTGLFLIVFLAVHLTGNLQLLYNDNGEAFNTYAYFMTSNLFIKITSIGLYTGILLHAIQGILIWRRNVAARGTGYKVKKASDASFSSRNMGWLGVIIAIFLALHLYQFWAKMHFGTMEMINYHGYDYAVKDLYSVVDHIYSNPVYVIIYVISMIVVGLHLWHGFQSAFQSLGLNHKKYTPLIKGLGMIYTIVVTLGFAIIPIYMYLN